MSDAAPFYADLADGPQGAVAHWVTTSDGLRLRLALWTGPDVRGTVLLFPGRTEYVEKYGRDATELLHRGFATLAVDWRGQGLADRMTANRNLGHVGAFVDYQQDVAAMLAHARVLALPEPFFLLAHSMGGCIGLRALNEGLPVQAAAFSAPMWGIQMAAGLRPVAWGLSSLGGALGFGATVAPGQTEENMMLRTPFAANPLTTDPDMYAYMSGQVRARPELALGGPTLRWLNESLAEMRDLSRLPSPATPCVTWLGTAETIVDPDRIKSRMAAWPNGRLVLLDGCKHEVLMEGPAVRTRVFDEMATHFAQASKPARAAG